MNTFLDEYLLHFIAHARTIERWLIFQITPNSKFGAESVTIDVVRTFGRDHKAVASVNRCELETSSLDALSVKALAVIDVEKAIEQLDTSVGQMRKGNK